MSASTDRTHRERLRESRRHMAEMARKLTAQGAPQELIEDCQRRERNIGLRLAGWTGEFPE